VIGLVDKKGQGVGSALPPALLQQYRSADSRGASERLWQPALHPWPACLALQIMGTITYSAVALSTRTTIQKAIAVVDVFLAIGYWS